MLYPPVADMLKNVDSRYLLVNVVAQRARVISDEAEAFGEELTEKIERETGVESRFARLAHVVRGGKPSLRDRLLASRMGEFAVLELLAGRSNEVICEIANNIVAVDINYALVLDRMYKNKLKPGDLDRFSEEEIASMREACARRRGEIEELYETVNRLGL